MVANNIERLWRPSGPACGGGVDSHPGEGDESVDPTGPVWLGSARLAHVPRAGPRRRSVATTRLPAASRRSPSWHGLLLGSPLAQR